TVSGEISKEIRERFEEAGAQVSSLSYHHQPLRYWAYVRRQARRHNVLLVQVRFFNYFSLLLWICRFSGIARIMFTEANGGEWSARGDWRTMLVRLRAAVASRPV